MQDKKDKEHFYVYNMGIIFFLFFQFTFFACGDKEDTAIEDTSSNSTLSSFDGMDFVYHSSDGYTPVEGSTIRVRFRENNGGFSFSADCNTHTGSYTLNEDTFKIQDLYGTEIGCETSLMEQDMWLVSFTSFSYVVFMMVIY